MRFPDWQSRLVSYLSEVSRKPFGYGTHDCALFAAGAVAAMTGIDLAEGWHGRYTDLLGGMRVLRAAGYRDHVHLVEANFEAIPVAFAAMGDIAVVPSPEGDALGIVQGEGIYVLTLTQLSVEPISHAKRAFRVV